MKASLISLLFSVTLLATLSTASGRNSGIFVDTAICCPGTSAGSNRCHDCKEGTFAVAGSDNCTACPAGSFSFRGDHQCHLCPAGTFAGSAGSGECTRCPHGTFAGSAGSHSCTPCPAGSFSFEGANECHKCPAGTFARGVGNDRCSRCPPGTASIADGATKCANCDLNFAQARFSGLTQCDVCPDGAVIWPQRRCHRKIHLVCPNNRLGEVCRSTIDRDLGTVGTIPPGARIRYTLSRPSSVSTITLWREEDCCAKDVDDVYVYFSTHHHCSVDQRPVKSTRRYIILSCIVDTKPVTYVEVRNRHKHRSLTIREIEFDE